MKLIIQSKIIIFFNHEIRFDFNNNDKNKFYIIKNEFNSNLFFENDIIFINAQRITKKNSFSIFNIK